MTAARSCRPVRLLFATACGGSPPKSATLRLPAPVRPDRPGNADVAPGGTLKFTAQVTGSAETSVTWEVEEADGGTIDTTGLYTAPAIEGTFHVRASSIFASVPKGKSVVHVRKLTTTQPVVGVEVTPGAVNVPLGGSTTFAAAVTGTPTWPLPGPSRKARPAVGLVGRLLQRPGRREHLPRRGDQRRRHDQERVRHRHRHGPPVVTVSVSPASTSVVAGGTVTFVATVSGTTLGQPTTVTWSVPGGGGTIGASTGVYVAPATPGTYVVTATSIAAPTAVGRHSHGHSRQRPGHLVLHRQPSSITSGGASTLAWSVSGATSLSINQGVGTVTGTSRAVTPPPRPRLHPDRHERCRRNLRHRDGDGGRPHRPLISSFTATPSVDHPAVARRWPGASAGPPRSPSTRASARSPGTSRSVTPAATTTYTLTATNAAGTATANATVTVTAAVPPPSPLHRHAPGIASGGTSTLAWSVTGATSLSINQGVGTVTGTARCRPAATTTYTLTATNAAGTRRQRHGDRGPRRPRHLLVHRHARRPSPPVARRRWPGASAGPPRSPSTRAWARSPAPVVVVSPAATTTYTLTATNAAGSITASATVTVGDSATHGMVIPATHPRLWFTAANLAAAKAYYAAHPFTPYYPRQRRSGRAGECHRGHPDGQLHQRDDLGPRRDHLDGSTQTQAICSDGRERRRRTTPALVSASAIILHLRLVLRLHDPPAERTSFISSTNAWVNHWRQQSWGGPADAREQLPLGIHAQRAGVGHHVVRGQRLPRPGDPASTTSSRAGYANNFISRLPHRGAPARAASAARGRSTASTSTPTRRCPGPPAAFAMGRDLFTESNYWTRVGLPHLIYSLSPAPTSGSGTGQAASRVGYTFFPYSDDKMWLGGQPRINGNDQRQLHVHRAHAVGRATSVAQHARQWLNATGATRSPYVPLLGGTPAARPCPLTRAFPSTTTRSGAGRALRAATPGDRPPRPSTCSSRTGPPPATPTPTGGTGKIWPATVVTCPARDRLLREHRRRVRRQWNRQRQSVPRPQPGRCSSTAPAATTTSGSPPTRPSCGASSRAPTTRTPRRGPDAHLRAKRPLRPLGAGVRLRPIPGDVGGPGSGGVERRRLHQDLPRPLRDQPRHRPGRTARPAPTATRPWS